MRRENAAALFPPFLEKRFPSSDSAQSAGKREWSGRFFLRIVFTVCRKKRLF